MSGTLGLVLGLSVLPILSEPSRRRRRLVGLLALATLVVGTLVAAVAQEIDLATLAGGFASQPSGAVTAFRLGGLLVALHLFVSACHERAGRSAAPSWLLGWPVQPSAGAKNAAAAGLAGLIVGLFLAPSPSSKVAEVATNVGLGLGYGTGRNPVEPAPEVWPLEPLMLALFPFGTQLVPSLAAAAIGASVSWLTHRRWPSVPSVSAGIGAATVLCLLPLGLTAFLVVAGMAAVMVVALARPTRPWAVGLAAGVATLVHPVAAISVLSPLMVSRTQPAADRAVRLTWAMVTWALVVLPWAVWSLGA